MADEAVARGLVVRPRAYSAASKLEGVDPSGPIHGSTPFWKLLGPGRRTIPEGAHIHASVEDRLAADPSYATRLPKDHDFVDPDWRTPRKAPPREDREAGTVRQVPE